MNGLNFHIITYSLKCPSQTGDKLNEGDLLAEIETDKATMGFETPEEGFLAKILINAGSKNVPIGKLVCIIVSSQSDVAAFQDFKDEGGDVAPPPAAAAPSPPPPAVGTPPPSEPSSPATPSIPSSTASGERIYASPLAKRLAAEKGLSLQVIVSLLSNNLIFFISEKVISYTFHNSFSFEEMYNHFLDRFRKYQ